MNNTKHLSLIILLLTILSFSFATGAYVTLGTGRGVIVVGEEGDGPYEINNGLNDCSPCDQGLWELEQDPRYFSLSFFQLYSSSLSLVIVCRPIFQPLRPQWFIFFIIHSPFSQLLIRFLTKHCRFPNGYFIRSDLVWDSKGMSPLINIFPSLLFFIVPFASKISILPFFKNP